jgi:arabinogalactan endo-1,4-beta-galactosidase
MERSYKSLAITALLAALAACSGDAQQQVATQPAPRLLASSTAATVPSFPGYRANYAIARSGSSLTVTDNVGTGGTVTLPGDTKRIEFYDGVLVFDTDSGAAQTYRIYQAAFGRPADSAGLGYWIDNMERGASVASIAAGFVSSAEFKAIYGASPTNRDIATRFYQNVLGRAPDAAGLDYWTKVLDTGAADVPSVLAGFADSPENKTLLAPKFQDGVFYSLWTPRTFSPNDDFREASLDSCRWFNYGQQAPAPAFNNSLVLSTSATESVSLPKLVSQYTVRGSFSVNVGISVDDAFNTAIPDSAQKYAGIGLYMDSLNYVLLSVAREGGRTVVKPLIRRAGAYQNLPVATPSSAVTALSIKSDGTQLTFSYTTAAGSGSAGSAPNLGDGEFMVTLQAATIGVQQAFNASFHDYTVTGTHSYRPYVRGPLTARPDFMTGGVVESYLYDTLFGQNAWGGVNAFEVMSANGMGWLRTTVTTQSSATLRNTPTSGWLGLPWDSNYWQSQEATAELIRQANARGTNAILSFFLSDTAASASAQNAPAAWRGLSVADTADKVRAHTRSIAADYKARGLKISLYEIGNEIDTGILNFRPGERIPLPADGNVTDNLDYMRTQVWPTEATLLKAGIAGVREVDPNAKIILHAAMLGNTPADAFVKAFYKAMVDNGVPFDIAGLSLPYPQGQWRLNEYASDCWFGRLQETTDYLARIGKKSMIVEGAYGNSSQGMVAKPMTEFPYSDAGQTAWVRENLRFGNNNPNMQGFMYFYPDWYYGRGHGDPAGPPLESYGLFNPDKTARPALKQFRLPPR